MSVYTSLRKKDVETILAEYDLGVLRSFEGIASGTENSNFFVHTDQGAFVLTLFEEAPSPRIDPFLIVPYANFLCDEGLPVPHTFSDRKGKCIGAYKGKSLVVAERIDGGHKHTAGLKEIEAIGALLARIHQVSLDRVSGSEAFSHFPWYKRTLNDLLPFLSGSDTELLGKEITYQESLRLSIPMALLHGDTFLDNALFKDDAIVGLIDFYLSSYIPLAYDMAVVLIDWCFDKEKKNFSSDKLQRFFESYEALRPLSSEERASMPDMLRRVALRFSLSRLHSHHLPRDGASTLLKDIDFFPSLLRLLKKEGSRWPFG